jgi:hypothetical protein
MKRTIAAIAALAVLALAVPAQAKLAPSNKAVEYEGKTSSGNPITFTLKKKKLWDMESGIAVTCLPIQGGGSPQTGSETFSYEGAVPLSAAPVEFEFMKTPAFYYNEVTVKHQLSSKIVRKNGLITGTQRIQYSFLIPKYPIGTFSIYSCLGEGTFRAKPVV